MLFKVLVQLHGTSFNPHISLDTTKSLHCSYWRHGKKVTLCTLTDWYSRQPFEVVTGWAYCDTLLSSLGHFKGFSLKS